MNFEVTEKATGASEVMSDHQIEQKFGAMGFTQMIAETHDTHIAVDIGGSVSEDDFMNDDDFIGTDDFTDILDALG